MSLKNKWIAITRPSHQAGNFRKMLEQAEANAILFPLLQINPPEDLAVAQKQLETLQSYDLVIFVSTNAVEQTFQWIELSSLNHLKIATTGKKTAAMLTELGVKIDFCPKKIFNSEALLALPEFQPFCKGKKVAIIRGEGGRDLLKNTLSKNDTQIDYINIYKRVCPQNNLQLLEQHWKQNQLDRVLLTSETSVISFFKLAENADWINKLTLVLGSPRMQGKIPNSFQGKLLIADDPSDETLFRKLIEDSKNNE